MTPQVDPKSFASHFLALFAHSVEVGTGTGFLVGVDDFFLLLTNYHVLSGKRPDNGAKLVPAAPDRILLPLLRKVGPDPCWRPVVQDLLVDGNPAWVEHPTLGSQFDVVALPIDIPADVMPVPYARDPGRDVALLPGSEVAIVGFPKGVTGAGVTAIWKSGTIASEPELSIDGNPYFWIDANTRPGMSGAPVIARRFGGSLMADGGYALHTGVVDRVVGVYSGRALDMPDMTIGRVWKWSGVQEVIDAASAKVRKGTVRPRPSLLGHYRNGESHMVKVDIGKSATVKVRNAAGVDELKTITLRDLIKDLVLADQRFGISLERVKMAAAIEAACESAAKASAPLELDDQQYAVVREVVEKPSAAYNPAVARYLVPLLQHVVDAGQGQ